MSAQNVLLVGILLLALAKPNRLVALLWLGVISLTLGLLAAGIGLVIGGGVGGLTAVDSRLRRPASRGTLLS